MATGTDRYCLIFNEMTALMFLNPLCLGDMLAPFLVQLLPNRYVRIRVCVWRRRHVS